MKCEISWIDRYGRNTADDNEAIGYVYREAYTIQSKDAWRGFIEYTETERFPICAEHAKRLQDTGMEHWHFVPLVDK